MDEDEESGLVLAHLVIRRMSRVRMKRIRMRMRMIMRMGIQN